MSKPENVRCPNCEGPMVPRTSQHGKFWGCANYPRCKGTRNAEGESKQRFDDDRDPEPEDMPSNRWRDRDKSRWR